jgi:hypothetical protein
MFPTKGKGIGPGGKLVGKEKQDRCTSRIRKKLRITPMMISVEKAHKRDNRTMLIKKEGKRLKQLS